MNNGWDRRWEGTGGAGVAGGHEAGFQAEPARVWGGRERRPRGRAGPLPARAGGVRSWRSPTRAWAAACGRSRAVTGGAGGAGVRSAVVAGRRAVACDGARLEGEREA